MSAQPVFVVVVTFNAPPGELASCISALQHQTLPPTEILVVDNDSATPADGASLSRLGTTPVRTVRLPSNVGPAGGFAAGLAEFLDSSCRYVWLMDDDVQPQPDCLRELVAALAEADDQAVMGPVLIDVVTGSPMAKWGWHGALVPREAVARAGLPSVPLFWGLEDQEYLRDRLPLAGFPLQHSERAIAHIEWRHRLNAPWKTYYTVRNLTYRYLYGRRHIPTMTRLRSLLFALYENWKLAWTPAPERPTRLEYFARGLVDGVLGRLGKRVDPAHGDRPWGAAAMGGAEDGIATTKASTRASGATRRWLLAARNAGRASVGYASYRRTGTKSDAGTMGLRGLFTTHPELPRTISRVFSIAHRPEQSFPATGILGTLDGRAVDVTTTALRNDGFHVFERLVDEEVLRGLDALGSSLPMYASLDVGPTDERVAFDPDDVVRSRYVCDQSDLVGTGVIQDLVADRSLGAVADAYLGCDAVQVDVGLWRSVVFGADTSSASAQMFHSDRDHLRFVKFFVYLSDVAPGTGPHVFVRGSHRSRPVALRRDVRFTDDEVSSYYRPADIVEICGPRGTVVAVDTSGIHKGKLPESGERWILELQYGSSLFGPGGAPFTIELASPVLADRLVEDARKFSRFTIRRDRPRR